MSKACRSSAVSVVNRNIKMPLSLTQKSIDPSQYVCSKPSRFAAVCIHENHLKDVATQIYLAARPSGVTVSPSQTFSPSNSFENMMTSAEYNPLTDTALIDTVIDNIPMFSGTDSLRRSVPADPATDDKCWVPSLPIVGPRHFSC